MAIVSMADFALHVQDYLEQVIRGETVKIQVPGGQCVSLVPEPIEKQYKKEDFLRLLSYQGGKSDSSQIDELIY